MRGITEKAVVDIYNHIMNVSFNKILILFISNIDFKLVLYCVIAVFQMGYLFIWIIADARERFYD